MPKRTLDQDLRPSVMYLCHVSVPLIWENSQLTMKMTWQHMALISHYRSALPALAADGGCVSEWPLFKVTLAERKTKRKIDRLAVYSE